MDALEFQQRTNVPRETLEKFEHFRAELVTWQKKINLVGPKTIHDVWMRHFFDCWQLKPLILGTGADFHNGKWVDLGSGAGFPGLVVAILGAADVNLIEANGKKCVFMRHICRELDLSVVVHQKRIEEIQGLRADIVTSRALADFGDLLKLSRSFVKSTTEIWFFKGLHIEEELTNTPISRSMVIEKHRSLSDDRGWLVRITGVGDETDVG